MRKKLKKLHGQCCLFTAEVSKFGSHKKYLYSGSGTVLLTNVRHVANPELIKARRISDYRQIASHLWMNTGKWSKNLRVGETIRFEAEVINYIKRVPGGIEIDYTLSKPLQRPHILTHRKK